MDLKRNVPHKFDLSADQAGDWFLGCEKCWARLPAKVAARPFCPECGEPQYVFYVTAEDVAPLTRLPRISFRYQGVIVEFNETPTRTAIAPDGTLYLKPTEGT